MSFDQLKVRWQFNKLAVLTCYLSLLAALLPQLASAQRQKGTYRCAHRLLGQKLGGYYWDSSEQAYFQNEFIELKPDGSFFFQDYGMHLTGYGGIESYYGKYDVDGNVITLKFEGLFGMAKRGTLEGSTIEIRMEDCDKYSSAGVLSSATGEAKAGAGVGAISMGRRTETLTNDDILNMVKAKLGDEVVVAKIKACKCKLDTSTAALINLKHAGVSDTILQAMAQNDEQLSAQPTTVSPTGSQSSTPEVKTAPEPQPSSAAEPTQFHLQHRHTTLFGPGSQAQSLCIGTLSVFPDGTVKYDCDQTQDPSGRCDHVVFGPGSLKEVKIGLTGALHIASKTQGKFDFMGDSHTVKRAEAAIAPLVQK